MINLSTSDEEREESPVEEAKAPLGFPETVVLYNANKIPTKSSRKGITPMKNRHFRNSRESCE